MADSATAEQPVAEDVTQEQEQEQEHEATTTTPAVASGGAGAGAGAGDSDSGPAESSDDDDDTTSDDDDDLLPDQGLEDGTGAQIMHGACPACKKPATHRFLNLTVPFFKDIIIMAFR